MSAAQRSPKLVQSELDLATQFGEHWDQENAETIAEFLRRSESD